jgi:aconitate hydratase
MDNEITFKTARMLAQDFTGIPAVVDIASLCASYENRGKDPEKIHPFIPVGLMVDYSVQVEFFGTKFTRKKPVLVNLWTV